jgi:hypothetical protein
MEEGGMRVPASLIIDDGAPVNLMYWQHPHVRHVQRFPNGFLRQFADVCDRYGATGKFTILPMPSALGRIDRGLCHLPAGHLAGFLDLARRRIAPRWDITPELLTHDVVFDLRTGRFRREFEDAWVARASVAEMTDYLALAFRILRGVGLPANGVTSPWVAGIDNERRYAEAIARAQRRVHRRRFAWYFLHLLGKRRPSWPWVAWRSRTARLVCVTVPANTDDPFGRTCSAGSARAAQAAAEDGADAMLSPDGRRGRLREVFDAGCPLVILTHWQNLYSEGRRAGLWGLQRLLGRMESVFGEQVEWMPCSRLARLAPKRC